MFTEPIHIILHRNIDMTLADDLRKKQVQDLIGMVDNLCNIIHSYHCYPQLDNPLYDLDDEIINWTFSDVQADLLAAISSLLLGQYKASASLLRNAQELAFASLFFQLKQNEPANRNKGLNTFFRAWDSGMQDTPNWGATKPVLNKNIHINLLATKTGINVVEEAYILYKELCSYTHNRAFDRQSNPVTTLNLYRHNFLQFEAELFDRFHMLCTNTISSIAEVWLTTFPELNQLAANKEIAKSLLISKRSKVVLEYLACWKPLQ